MAYLDNTSKPKVPLPRIATMFERGVMDDPHGKSGLRGPGCLDGFGKFVDLQGEEGGISKAPWLDGLVYHGGARCVVYCRKEEDMLGGRVGVKRGPPGFENHRNYEVTKHGKKTFDILSSMVYIFDIIRWN